MNANKNKKIRPTLEMLAFTLEVNSNSIASICRIYVFCVNLQTN